MYIRKTLLFTFVAIFLALASTAQLKPISRIQQQLDFTAALGHHEGTISLAYVHNWGLGKKRKLELGLGLRITSYLGEKKEFYTAPAKYARSSSFPFAIVFAGHEEQNIDTLTVQRPFTTALNLTLNAGYHFGSRWYAGFNIDLVGFTLGHGSSGILLSNGKTTTEPVAKPAAFNVLLTGDYDYGSLNSEFFIRYNIASRWDIKAVYQFVFTEYKTETIYQTAPDGNAVYRFRNKANLLGLGVCYRL